MEGNRYCHSFDQIEHVAMEIECAAFKPPFVYLGIPVGQNMTRVQAWKSLLDSSNYGS